MTAAEILDEFTLPEMVAEMAFGAGFEVRPGLGQFELLGSIDSLAILIEQLLCSKEGHQIQQYFNLPQETP